MHRPRVKRQKCRTKLFAERRMNEPTSYYDICSDWLPSVIIGIDENEFAETLAKDEKE